jgi:monoamine oxidase
MPGKPARTPLLRWLRTAYRLAAASHRTGLPTDELLDLRAEDRLTRRRFLESTGKVALLGTVLGTQACRRTDEVPPQPALFRSGARLSGTPRVAIVGAGIAGLHAAHLFKKAGFENFTLYEAANRTGGRMFTARNIMAPGLTTELGGEFIDSGHADMRNLAAEFGLTLLDTQAPSELALVKDVYLFKGTRYTLAQVTDAFRPLAPRLEQDYNALPDDIGYNTTDRRAVRLDNTSISEYLLRIGARGFLRELLEVAYETEFGLSCGEQSSLNLLTLISTEPDPFEIFGDSDERYKIAGGNQQLTDKLTQLYQNYLETGRRLLSLRPRSGAYELEFTGKTVQADLVLLTLPFTLLREVDLRLPLPGVKRRAIQTLGYGTNAKLMLGMQSRVWRTQGVSGYYFTDNGAQSGWDNSQLQPGTAGGLTVYTGGSTGVRLGQGSAAQQAAAFLPKLNALFPGVAAQFNGNAERFHWPTYPFTKGSYACYRTGQWTGIGGAEGEPVGNLYFAGEHCSRDFQGYMNGGAETGRVAAGAMLAAMGVVV